MFGGGSTDAGNSSTGNAGAQATLTESSPVMTSSTGPVYANTPETGAPNSGWEQAMVVSPARSNSAAKPAPVTAQTPKAAGSIRLQVAAVRSREEAERVSAKLKSMPAVQSAAATPAIDEAVIGNMGTFYRVRLGPFANAAEPDKLCASLKPQGYDCLVVAQ
jgi:cell division septation protein DedD